MVFLTFSDFLNIIFYNYILQKSASRIGFLTIFEAPGPLFEASVSMPFRKSYAFDIRKMYKNGISLLFLMLFFNPLKCKILLLALVFSLFLDRRESTFFIIFGPKIVSGLSVAVGHPRQMLCFLHSGDPFPPRGIFCHFYIFSTFFKFLHEWLLSQNIAFRLGKTHIRENPLDELLRLRIFLDAAKRPKYCFSLR